MSEASDLEAQLKKQQADYLNRLEKAGSLPTVISEAWQKAGGEEQKALRTKESDLLKNYTTASARAIEANKNIWDPYSRMKHAAADVQTEYSPIADIRSELAMRAEALGIATSSATSMYGAETTRAETGIGFTESAYARALAREQEATRVRENAEALAREQAATAAAAKAKKSTGGGGGTKAKTVTPTNELKSYLAETAARYREMPWDQMVQESKAAGIDPVFFRDAIYRQALDAYGDTLSQSAIRNLVYNQYFPDGWR